MSDKTKVHSYPGDKVDVTWNGDLCIHIGECGRASGGLFVGGRQPWCQPNVVGVDDVSEVVKRCPTGALSYIRKDAGAEETPAARNVVVVANQGPLYVSGDLEIEGAGDERPGVRFRAALCRCGQSKNKPFCDNTHESVDFRDRGPVGDTGPGSGGEGGRLTIRPAKNGPLLLSGNLTIVSGSGRVAWRGKKTALCRCGASKNKPFCDGSHNEVGFVGE